MCTALTLEIGQGYHLFGRNMDIEYNFNQQVMIIPRKFEWCNRVADNKQISKYATIAMGTIMEGHPLLAEGMNEKGLACAGLNFPKYGYFEENAIEGKTNLGPYDMIYWMISNFETLDEVKEALKQVNLVNKPFLPSAPIVPLHWIVTDCTGKSIVIEKVREGMKVYDNQVGILSNAPTFEWHMTNLTQYMGLESKQPDDTSWNEVELKPLGQGLGLFGMPGDFSSPSRFVRAAYLRNHITQIDSYKDGLAAFFHILNNVAMVAGSVITPDGKDDITLYTSCMCQETGVYYYKTYKNPQIQKIDMKMYDLESKEIQLLGYNELFNI